MHLDNVYVSVSRELGMDVSLFERLDGLGATSELRDQYRMNR